MELVEDAAARYGTCEKLARKLGIPESSINYRSTRRLTLPASLLEKMLVAAGDATLERRVQDASRTKDRTWANSQAAGIQYQAVQSVNVLEGQRVLELQPDHTVPET